jgi:hypothetical protein
METCNGCQYRFEIIACKPDSCPFVGAELQRGFMVCLSQNKCQDCEARELLQKNADQDCAWVTHGADECCKEEIPCYSCSARNYLEGH